MLTLPLNGLAPDRLAFSPDGTLLAGSAAGQPLTVWDAVTGRRLWATADPCVRRSAAGFSPDGRRLVLGGPLGRVFDARSGAADPDPTGPEPGTAGWPLPLGFPAGRSPCGRWVVVPNVFATTFRDEAGGRQCDLSRLGKWTPGMRKPPHVYPLAFSPDGDLLVFGGRWLVAVGTAGLAAGDPRPVVVAEPPGVLQPSAAFTPDGRTLLAAGDDGRVRGWDTATWHERAGYDPGAGPLTSLAVSPIGRRVAVAGTERIAVWDLD